MCWSISHQAIAVDCCYTRLLQRWGDDDDSMDDDDDDDDLAEMRGLRMSAAKDTDVSCCNLTVPSVGITVTVSPPSPDCTPADGHQPPHDDHLTGISGSP